MANEIEETYGNAWQSHTTNRKQLRSYNNSLIEILGTRYCEVESNGWNCGPADLTVVPNNSRAVIGRESPERKA